MNDYSDLYKQVNTAVVSIHSVLNNQIVAGCGFFYKMNNRNYIITAAHNIGYNKYSKTNMIKCSFTHNSQYQSRDARIVGTAFYTDLAVLELVVPLYNVNTLSFASNTPNIGQSIIAIGNSLGLDHNSLSDGLVRDNAFYIEKAFPVISVSTPILSGNSGGPLINAKGKIISIVNAGFGDYEAYNWGLNTLLLKKLAEKIITTNSDYYVGTLKCQYKSLDGVDAFRFGISDLSGLLITKSYNSSLKKNDIIKKINNQVITADNITNSIILNADKYITLQIIRQNRLYNLSVYVSKINENEDNVYGEYENKNTKKYAFKFN